MKRVSLIFPVYNEAENLPPLRRRLESTLDTVPGFEFEILLVDDRSTDQSRLVALDWAKTDRRVQYLRLSRNFGSHAALAAGLSHCTGDCAVLLAADLQDPPELIPELLARWEKGPRVVWATRTGTAGTNRTAQLTSRAFWWLMQRGAPDAVPAEPADFVLVDRAVIDAYARVATRNESLLATVCWLGFEQACVPYDKEPRRAGRSGWTFAKRWKLFVDSIVGFSYWPIRAMCAIGFAVALLGFVFLIYVVWHRLTGRTAVPGWAGMMAVLLTGMGVLMGMVGVLGEYLWRVLDEIRGRPKFVIEEVRGGLAHASRATGVTLPRGQVIRGAGEWFPIAEAAGRPGIAHAEDSEPRPPCSR